MVFHLRPNQFLMKPSPLSPDPSKGFAMPDIPPPERAWPGLSRLGLVPFFFFLQRSCCITLDLLEWWSRRGKVWCLWLVSGTALVLSLYAELIIRALCSAKTPSIPPNLSLLYALYGHASCQKNLMITTSSARLKGALPDFILLLLHCKKRSSECFQVCEKSKVFPLEPKKDRNIIHLLINVL